MDCLEFNPSIEYLNLINISNERKTKLNLHGLSYYQLSKKELFKKYNYELHHIVPRYRFKNTKCKKELNSSENIAVLTSSEHLFAHLYLTKFENSKYKHSADMAFIQLTSLKSKDFLEILTDVEISTLIENVSKSRKDYFGSKQHKDGSIKAGKISGQKRKERFTNDPEFRKEILNNFQKSPEQRKMMIAKLLEKNSKLPPWEVNSAYVERKDRKYKRQLWEYFDSIYEGVFRYGLSYKAIAKVLEVDYKRISNIVRTLKEKYKGSPSSFEDFKYYDNFVITFKKLNFLQSRFLFEKYLATK